jgi:hypothetical protein
MYTLPTRFAPFILSFAPLFRQRTWRSAQTLLVGAILAPGRRTVASVLRILGLGHERHFCNYHRVLSRAAWSARAASRILLGLLVRTFVPTGPIVLALDDTLERRRGRRIAATRMYRDPVRSSHTHTITVSALRWLSVMLLVPVPWARRVWALPFFTVLTPSAPARGPRPAKRLAEWARQMLRQVSRWLDTLAPDRPVIAVADASFAALELLAGLAPRLTCITRLRLDASLYAPAPPRLPGTPGRRPSHGARLPALAARATDSATRWARVIVPAWYGTGPRPLDLVSGTAVWYSAGRPVVPIRWVLVRDPTGTFKPQAFLSTDLALTPLAIIQYYLQRWQVEVTFEEARRHLGLETQRQWSSRAIARTTPVLLGLFSLVTLCAEQLTDSRGQLPLQCTAWYRKEAATFADALGVVRRHWWRAVGFVASPGGRKARKPPPGLVRRLTEALCDAA